MLHYKDENTRVCCKQLKKKDITDADGKAYVENLNKTLVPLLFNTSMNLK